MPAVAVLGRTGNASDVARDVIRQLAARRMPPTPDNYSMLYAEISGNEALTPGEMALKRFAAELTHGPATAALARTMLAALNKKSWSEVDTGLSSAARLLNTPPLIWSDLLRNLVRQWDTRQTDLSTAQKHTALEQALSGAGADNGKLHQRVSSLVKTWAGLTPLHPSGSPGAAASAVAALAPAKMDLAAAAALRTLLAQTLELAVVARLGYTPDLAAHAARIALACREAGSVKDINRLTQDLKQFWIRLELRGETVDQTMHALTALLRLLIGNAAELAGEDAWMKAQMERAQSLLADPVDLRGLREAEKSFREVAVRQGAIRHSLDEAKAAFKSMVGLFIDRIGAMTDMTGDFQAKVGRYAGQIESADDIAQLSAVLADLLSDTRGVQASMQRTRDELERSRLEAQQREEHVRHLERELEAAANLVKVDPLTSVLNRRGLNEAYAVEEARAVRTAAPLCVALLDIDNFKHLNDKLGHQAGDGVLQHLAAIMRETVRPSDVVSRYGGEEFVLLLPQTPIDEAEKVMQRVQRELTRRLFLHNNERVLITFSAGVALGRPGENRDEHISRADAAMYQAKTSGKNRVCCAA